MQLCSYVAMCLLFLIFLFYFIFLFAFFCFMISLLLAINRVDSPLFRSSPELPSGSGEAFSWSLQWGNYRIFLFLACLCFWKLIEL